MGVSVCVSSAESESGKVAVLRAAEPGKVLARMGGGHCRRVALRNSVRLVVRAARFRDRPQTDKPATGPRVAGDNVAGDAGEGHQCDELAKHDIRGR